MAINKKLIHFKNKSKFNEELANNNILETSICFIQDTQEIWTHGQLYNCASIPADQRTLAYAEYTGTSTTAAVDTKSGYFPEILTEGASVAVKFEGNISYISTLNVNGTGAKNVYYKGNSLSGGSISRYNTYLFVYDGSYYRIVGIDTDTHHSAKNVVTSSATSKSNAAATNGNVYLNLIENSTVRSKHKIVGTGATTVTSDSSGNITIDTTLPNYIVPFTEDDLSTWLNAVNDNDYFTSSALTDDLTNISNAITNNVPLVLQGPNTELFPVVGHVSSGFLSLHILTFWENEPTSWLLTYNITSHMGDIRKYSIVDYATNTALVSALRDKQNTLVSGETIKTINGTSILGSGDIAIEGGGGNVYTWSVPTDGTTGTVTPEEYAAIKEASQVYIEMEGVYYQALKMNAGEHGSLILSTPVIMNDITGTTVAIGLCVEIFSDLTFNGSVFMVNIPTKTSQLTNDANFVAYANFEWDGSSEGTVTQAKFEELRNADIVIVKQQDGDIIAHACKTSGGAVIFYYSTTMDNIISSAMFIVMDHDYSWTCSTSQTTIPAAVTEATVSGWGFTKNTGTVTGVKINGNTQNPSNGVVDLGTVITEHQPLKTINGESILGSGDIAIEGGSSGIYVWEVSTDSDSGTITPETYDALYNAPKIVLKQDNGAEIEMIKMIDGDTILLHTIQTAMMQSSDVNHMYIVTMYYYINPDYTYTKDGGMSVIPTGVNLYSKPSNGIPKSDLASDVQTSLGKADTALQSYTEQYKGTITGVSANGTSVATSGVANIPAASTSKYGVTKLNSATNSTSTTEAATPSAVKAAYDLANNYKGTVTGVKINGTTKSPASGVVDLGYVNKQLSTSTSSSMTLSPNIYYRNTSTSLSTLTITLGSVSNSNILNEYFVEFTTRSSGTTVSLPSSIKWANGVTPTFENGKTYQISIVNNLGTCVKFG